LYATCGKEARNQEGATGFPVNDYETVKNTPQCNMSLRAKKKRVLLKWTTIELCSKWIRFH